MKKLLLLVLVALCVASSVEPVLAYYSYVGLDKVEKSGGKKAADAYVKRWRLWIKKQETSPKTYEN